MKRKRKWRKEMIEGGANVVFFLAAGLSSAALGVICLFLFAGGIPAIERIGAAQFLLGLEWNPSGEQYGVLPMIVGSILVTAGALAAGLPVGVLTAVFMVYYCPTRVYIILKSALGLMAGIPSVVYGLWGLDMLVPLIRYTFGGRGVSLLAASLLLGIMILPTAAVLCESAIRALPKEYFEGSLALGLSVEGSIFGVILPAASDGILAAAVLSAGRAVGETMAVVMVAGNQPLLPQKLTDGVRTLTAGIVMEMGYASGLHRHALIAIGVVLFAVIFAVNTLFAVIRERGER